MRPEEAIVTTNCLVDRSRLGIGNIPNIHRALTTFKESVPFRMDFRERVVDLENALNHLNQQIASPDLSSSSSTYQLARLMEGATVPTLGDMYSAVEGFKNNMFENNAVSYFGLERAFKRTFKKIAAYGENGNWDFISQVRDERVLFSALLVEGYGLFLAEYLHNPELQLAAVLAIEEQLLLQVSHSRLLNDVLPWMIEERVSFSGQARELLERMVVNPKR